MPYTGNPFATVSDAMVAQDAPVTSTLMSNLAIDNPNWLKSMMTDGANAAQGISASTLQTTGAAIFAGNLAVQAGSMQASGTLTWGAGSDFNNTATANANMTFVGVNLSKLQGMFFLNGY